MMFNSVIIFLTVQLIAFGSSSPSWSSDPLIVETSYGRVKGRVDLSRYQRPFFSFTGIPYAKPPVGPLRFRAPVPPKKWANVRDATKDKPMCIQANFLLYQDPPVEGDEDCLYLNVYTPKLPLKHYPFIESNTLKPLLPVMVYIHYGGFFTGTGNRDISGPEYFMDRDVIFVSVNFRLAVLGYLSTNDDVAPGNWALKDQLAALKWVRDNIENFGGNNKQVTIFGQSSGAGAIHYHLLSPTTKNLFHAAITQSGTALSHWARPDNLLQAQNVKQQAMFVGCKADTDTQTMVDCLRGINASTLVESSKKFKYFSAEPGAIFAPVIERRTAANPNPYITETPKVLIQQGKMHRVPLMNGVVQDEGILRASPLLRVDELYATLIKKFDEFGPLLFDLPRSVPQEKITNTWKKIKNFYLPSGSLNASSPESVQGFIDLYSDRMFNYAAYQTALIHDWKGHSPIWFYNFAYRGRYSYETLFATTRDDIDFKWGVSHCDELLYLLQSKSLFPPLDGADLLMSNIMLDLWTNFATYFHPTPIGDKYAEVWQPLPDLSKESSVKNSDLIYLNITGSYDITDNNPITMEMCNNFLPKRMKFWKSLAPNEHINGIE